MGEWVSESFIVSYLEIAIASPSFASLFLPCDFVLRNSLLCPSCLRALRSFEPVVNQLVNHLLNKLWTSLWTSLKSRRVNHLVDEAPIWILWIEIVFGPLPPFHPPTYLTICSCYQRLNGKRLKELLGQEWNFLWLHQYLINRPSLQCRKKFRATSATVTTVTVWKVNKTSFHPWTKSLKETKQPIFDNDIAWDTTVLLKSFWDDQGLRGPSRPWRWRW